MGKGSHVNACFQANTNPQTLFLSYKQDILDLDSELSLFIPIIENEVQLGKPVIFLFQRNFRLINLRLNQ